MARSCKALLVVVGALPVLFIGVGLYGVYGPTSHEFHVGPVQTFLVPKPATEGRAEARCRADWAKWGFLDAKSIDITRQKTNEGWRFYGKAVAKDGQRGYVDCLITFQDGNLSMLDSSWKRR